MATSGQGGTFQIPPHPATKQHFTEIARSLERKFKGPFHHGSEKKSISGTDGAAGRFQVKGSEALPLIFEDKQYMKTMHISASTPFYTGGETVGNTPLFTFIPSIILGL